MYIYIYVYIHLYTYIHIHTYIYIYIDACVGVQSATRASGMASVAKASGYKYIYICMYI